MRDWKRKVFMLLLTITGTVRRHRRVPSTVYIQRYVCTQLCTFTNTHTLYRFYTYIIYSNHQRRVLQITVNVYIRASVELDLADGNGLHKLLKQNGNSKES